MSNIDKSNINIFKKFKTSKENNCLKIPVLLPSTILKDKDSLE